MIDHRQEKRSKEMLKIVYNLDEFGEKIVSCIFSDGSTLIDIFKEVTRQYSYQDSPIWAWVYSFSRKRSARLNETTESLANFNDPQIRLQEFQKFFGEGSWETTSANTRLFIALINAIEGYEKESDAYLYSTVLFPLRDLLFKKIQNLLNQHEMAKRREMEREKELKSLANEKLKDTDRVFLFHDEEEAKLFALSQPDSFSFYLHIKAWKKEQPIWQLLWFDLTGSAVVLAVSADLAVILKSFEAELIHFAPSKGNPPSLANSIEAKTKFAAQLLKSPASLNHLKAACKKNAMVFLEKTRVLVNPFASQCENLTSTYVLSKEDGKLPQLIWYDSLAIKKVMNIEDYPDFARWLATRNELSADDFLPLKIYLRHMNTRSNVDENKRKKIKNLFQEMHGVTLISTDKLASVPPYKLIKDTYILTREPSTEGKWVLYQRQRAGRNATVNFKAWANTEATEQFEKILTDNNKFSAGKLPQSVIGELSECLKNAAIRSETVKALNNFSPQEGNKFKACSFVLTKEKEQWQLYYIDHLQRTVKVDMNTCPSDTQTLLLKWAAEPEALGSQQLNSLIKTLNNFKPHAAHALHLSNYSMLEMVLSRQFKTNRLPGRTPETGLPKALSGNITASSSRNSCKLSNSHFAVAGLFGQKTNCQSLTTNLTELPKIPIPS
jgi:hypothetical protein